MRLLAHLALLLASFSFLSAAELSRDELTIGKLAEFYRTNNWQSFEMVAKYIVIPQTRSLKDLLLEMKNKNDEHYLDMIRKNTQTPGLQDFLNQTGVGVVGGQAVANQPQPAWPQAVPANLLAKKDRKNKKSEDSAEPQRRNPFSPFAEPVENYQNYSPQPHYPNRSDDHIIFGERAGTQSPFENNPYGAFQPSQYNYGPPPTQYPLTNSGFNPQKERKESSRARKVQEQQWLQEETPQREQQRRDEAEQKERERQRLQIEMVREGELARLKRERQEQDEAKLQAEKEEQRRQRDLQEYQLQSYRKAKLAQVEKEFKEQREAAERRERERVEQAQARHQANIEARDRERKMQVEARRQAEIEARERERKMQAEAKRQAEIEARERELKMQVEARRQELKMQAEARRQAEIEARDRELKMQAEAKRQAEIETRERDLKMQAEAKRQAEIEVERNERERQVQRQAQLDRERELKMQAEARRLAEIEAERLERELQVQRQAQRDRERELKMQAEAMRQAEIESQRRLQREREAQRRDLERQRQEEIQREQERARLEQASANAEALGGFFERENLLGFRKYAVEHHLGLNDPGMMELLETLVKADDRQFAKQLADVVAAKEDFEFFQMIADLITNMEIEEMKAREAQGPAPVIDNKPQIVPLKDVDYPDDDYSKVVAKLTDGLKLWHSTADPKFIQGDIPSQLTDQVYFLKADTGLKYIFATLKAPGDVQLPPMGEFDAWCETLLATNHGIIGMALEYDVPTHMAKLKKFGKMEIDKPFPIVIPLRENNETYADQIEGTVDFYNNAKDVSSVQVELLPGDFIQWLPNSLADGRLKTLRDLLGIFQDYSFNLAERMASFTDVRNTLVANHLYAVGLM